MGDECEFKHEDFCILQLEYPTIPKCKAAVGDLDVCTIKKADLVEVCPDCINEICECE